MPIKNDTVQVSSDTMQATFESVLMKYSFDKNKAIQCASIFTGNSVDGIYTHGVNRFPRFVQYVKDGFIKINAVPILQNKFGGIEQWNGNLGPGPLNAIHATDTVMQLANEFGIGCVALANTNHWMRGGTYGWKAARAGYVFIGWTNTLGNLPAWGAVDPRIGNNPLVIALPYQQEAIVLDMAMSQFSFGALELAAMKNETLQVPGGFDKEGKLSTDPSAIITSRRAIPVGYWKGAGMALLLDMLSAILSGGLATHEINKQPAEICLSQVFIAIDIKKLGSQSTITKTIENILNDYLQSVPIDSSKKIVYPGERVIQTRQKNLANGIPVLKMVWDEILKL